MNLTVQVGLHWVVSSETGFPPELQPKKKENILFKADLLLHTASRQSFYLQ